MVVLLVTPIVGPFVLWLGVPRVAPTVLTLIVQAPVVLTLVLLTPDVFLAAADLMDPGPFVGHHHIG